VAFSVFGIPQIFDSVVLTVLSLDNGLLGLHLFVKCGKEMCQYKHGPYYYAYWRDPESKKLKKKYIGDHMPKEKKSNDDSPSNQVL
jgi:hypothetical protein